MQYSRQNALKVLFRSDIVFSPLSARLLNSQHENFGVRLNPACNSGRMISAISAILASVSRLSFSKRCLNNRACSLLNRFERSLLCRIRDVCHRPSGRRRPSPSTSKAGSCLTTPQRRRNECVLIGPVWDFLDSSQSRIASAVTGDKSGIVEPHHRVVLRRVDELDPVRAAIIRQLHQIATTDQQERPVVEPRDGAAICSASIDPVDLVVRVESVRYRLRNPIFGSPIFS